MIYRPRLSAQKLKIVLMAIMMLVVVFVPTLASAELDIQFTEAEQQLIYKSQNGAPVKIGIIPHTFPLSACPPEKPEFTGTNIEMLKLISKVSGLKFEYYRIPTEKMTPYQLLQKNEVQLVAGTIKLEGFVKNTELLLSKRFCDGAAICIAHRNTVHNTLKKGKVAVMSGYQAGSEFARKQFPAHEIVFYPNNKAVVAAVRNNEADLAMISRYVGVYELQSPFNEDLVSLEPYQMLADSCIMGLNTQDNKTAIAVIDKALVSIGEDEANHVQMHFSITHPYQLTILEVIFKYRYMFVGVGTVGALLFFLLAKLRSSQKEGERLACDQLTGAFSEAGFELAAHKVISKSNRQMFMVDFDISHFSSYNQLYGKDKGDALLIEIARIVRSFLCEQDVVCRSYADNFKVLVCKDTVEELIADIKSASVMFNQLLETRMVFKFGIYPITDKNISIREMLDFAVTAKKNAKNNPNEFIDVFDNNLHTRHLEDMTLLARFDNAIVEREFVAYYQPKFDTFSGAVIGAEALVRWITPNDKIIPPIRFIDLLEKNGLIQRLDFYMLEQVCIFHKNLLEQGLSTVPISVNFSRVHLFSKDFVNNFTSLVSSYNIPKHLIEIECTETAMTYDIEASKDILGRLQAQGFKIAMDDFGQAYSSLNALRAMPLDIVKLDRGFLEFCSGEERSKTRKIIKNMVLLLKDLSLKMVAEGVETETQYLFLKSVGCDYIQGYYFSRPLTEKGFVQLLNKG